MAENNKKPYRVKRQRTRGWRMPENTVYVGRGSSWGNPYIVGNDGVTDKADAKRRFYQMLHYGDYNDCAGWHDKIKEHLKGKNLACWCDLDEPCHADVLLQIANNELDTETFFCALWAFSGHMTPLPPFQLRHKK